MKEMSKNKEDQGQKDGAGKEEGLETKDGEEGLRHEGSSSPVHGFTTPGKIDDSLVVRAKMLQDLGIGQVSFIMYSSWVRQLTELCLFRRILRRILKVMSHL